MQLRIRILMKKISIVFLQVGIVALGICVLVALLWGPQLEGRNVNATLIEIYFKDPFLAYVYVGSIPFFVGLYQAFKVLGYVGQNKTFSQATAKALRIIKYCSVVTAGAIVAADAFLMIHARLYPELGATDGPEGAVALGIVATFASIVVATAAA